MHQHILIAVALDHEDLFDRKLALARRLLADGGKITLITVLENVPGFVTEFVDLKPENHLTQKVKTKLQELAAGADDIGAEVVLGKPGVQISEYATKNGVDLVLVGSHKPGLQDYFLGSTASRVTRRAPCAVFVVR